MDWVSFVPLWAWLVLAVLYALAGLGWFFLVGEDNRESDALSAVYGAIWPVTAVIVAVWLAYQAARRRHIRNQAWRGR